MAKFIEKHYKKLPEVDESKNNELFEIINNLNTHELLVYSIKHQISLDTTNNDKENLIHVVIKMDKVSQNIKLSIIKFLVSNKVNPDKYNKYNITPLHYACQYQLDLIIDYLLSVKANSNFKDNYGFTPFHYLLLSDLFQKDIKPKENDKQLIELKKSTENNYNFIEYHDLKKIKEKIWDKIKDHKLLKTIEKTVDNIIKFDNRLQINFLNIENQLLKDNNKNIVDTKKIIIQENNNIFKHISDIFKINNNVILDITKKNNVNEELTIWSPISNSKYYLIKEGNIKKLIKTQIKNNINSSIKINTEYKPEEYNLNKLFKLFITLYYTNLLNQFNDEYDRENKKNNVIEYLKDDKAVIIKNHSSLTDFNTHGELFRHHLVNTNSSDIIDIDNLKYTSGPKHMDIYYYQHYNDLPFLPLFIDLSAVGSPVAITLKHNTDRNIINNAFNNNGDADNPVKYRLIYNYLHKLFDINFINNEDKILYLLSIPFKDNLLGNKLRYTRIYLNNLFNDYMADPIRLPLFPNMFNNEFNDVDLWIFENDVDFNQVFFHSDLNNSDIHKSNLLCYINLSLLLIFEPERLNDINNKINLNNDYYINWQNKWINLFKNKKEYILIYDMWCDLNSKLSDNNLKCVVPFNLLMLISGLLNYKLNGGELIQNIVNSFKPHVFDYMYDQNQSNIYISFSKWILFLLHDNIDQPFIIHIFNNYIPGIDSNTRYIDMIAYIDDPICINVSEDLKNLVKIIYNYLLKKEDANFITNYEQNELYIKFNNNNLSPINIITNIIIHIYNNMNSKPLKQTILDTLYFINRDLYNRSVLNLYDFRLSYIFFNSNHIFYNNRNNVTNISYQPSFYGYINYIIDNDDHYYNHFLISHILGLHYQGALYKADIVNNFDFTFKNHNINLSSRISCDNLRLYIQRIQPHGVILEQNDIRNRQNSNLNFISVNNNNYHIITNDIFNGVNGYNKEFNNYFVVNRMILALIPPPPIPPIPLPLPPPRDIFLRLENVNPLDRNYNPNRGTLYSQIPFLLNYLRLERNDNFNYELKYKYYNIDTYKLSIPTIFNYLLLLIDRISFYEQKIKILLLDINKILYDLISGDSNHLSNLFLEKYPLIIFYINNLNYWKNEITMYLKIENKFDQMILPQINEISNEINKVMNIKIFDYGSLADNLNEINSLYYIYYYIFGTNNNFINLNKFNYIKLPTKENKNKFTNLDYNYFNIQPVNNNFFRFLNNGIDENVVPIDPNFDINNLPRNNQLYINLNSIGNYNLIFSEYTNDDLLKNYYSNDIFFVINNDLPPSLYEKLDKFYKYIIIKIIIEITDNIHNNKLNNEKEIYDLLIKISDNVIDEIQELYGYKIVGNIIEELIKDYLEKYINLYIFKQIRDIQENGFLLNFQFTMDKLSDDIIPNFDYTDIDFRKFNNNIDIFKNINITNNKKDINEDEFILYPNDFSINKQIDSFNISKINKKCIDHLINYKSSIYSNNNYGNSPFYSLIKNNNFKLIKYLKEQHNINYKNDNIESPIKIIIDDNLINLQKIINDDKNITDIKTCKLEIFLNNIDNFLYNESKNLFDNFEFKYLKESFNIITYITLHYLSTLLLNINSNFKTDDLNNALKLINFSINDITSNYFIENIEYYNINNDINEIIKNQYITKYNDEIEIIDKEIKDIDDLLRDRNNKSINDKLYIKKNKLNDNKNKINIKITDLKGFPRLTSIIKNKKPNSYSIIEDYFDENTKNIIINGWIKLFDDLINKNSNMLLINFLYKQYNILEKKNISLSDKEELFKINNVFKNISNSLENYFNNSKYKNDNEILEFVEQLLQYNCKIIIGSNIENYIRNKLFIYFLNKNNDNIIESINYILNTKIKNNKSILDILYNDICNKIVKFSSNIYNDIYDDKYTDKESIDDILKNFISLFQLIKELSDEFIIIIQDINIDILSIDKLINLWTYNIENIFRYFINNYRSLETLITLI